MFDKLEEFVNWLNDMDWAWWPLLSLRPPKDKDIDNLLLLKLALFYGSIIGVLFLAVVIIGTIDTLTLGNVLFFAVLCLLLGWTLAFILYKISIAYAWNRRARRFRDQQEYDMRVELYSQRWSG
jgi:hypothetical protein